MAAPHTQLATFADLLALPDDVRVEIADPLENTRFVHRWEPHGYLVVLTAGEADIVRAEPFEAVELRVAALFGLEDDEE